MYSNTKAQTIIEEGLAFNVILLANILIHVERNSIIAKIKVAFFIFFKSLFSFYLSTEQSYKRFHCYPNF